MPSTKPRINFVTDETLIKKMKFIADQNGRSMSKEIEQLCIKHIQKYEIENGVIKTDKP